ncbi:MAG TPA: MATE family efflux transporter [Phycisphaerales bacterium]|nr:MATE family efflux transporter [Phycisphaerales bacterium]
MPDPQSNLHPHPTRRAQGDLGPDPEALENAANVQPPPARRATITSDGRLTAGRLAGLSMTGAIFVLTWPILADSLLNAFVGLTDTILAAAIDDGGAATDAVGGAVTILWFVQLVVQAIGVGATALIARAVGGHRLGIANAALAQTILLAAGAGLVVGLAMAAIAVPAASIMNLSPDAAAGFIDYLRINAIGVPFGSVLFAGIACARGAGDSFRPLVVMLLVNFVNCLVSWLLSGVELKSAAVVNGEAVTRWVLHNLSPLHLGVSGIAWGTCISYILGCVMMTALLARGFSGIRLRRARLRPHWHTLRRLVRVGIPNFLETLGMWAGNMLIILMVGRMAADEGHAGFLGSHLLAVRIEAFSYLPGFAFASAAATLVGQYLGAGSTELARRAVNVCCVCASVFMGLMGLLFIAWPTSIVGLMTAQDIHLELTPPLLWITGIVQVPFAISIVYRTALRGAGDVRAAMWLTWITTYALRLPMAYLFSGVSIGLFGRVIANPSPWELGLFGVWIGLCAEIVIRAVLFLIRWRQGRWAHVRV